MMSSFFNLGLRGGGLVGKFLLIFFLARVLRPEELGVYGLITATVGYALFFLGLDFYTYAGRSMLHAEQKTWPSMLRDQGVLFACSYVVVILLLGLLFMAGLLPVEYALVFYVLLTVEHFSQELVRLLVIIGKPLSAGVLMFFRMGAWCYVLVAAYLGGLTAIELNTVLWSWVLADAVALAGSIWLLRKLPWSELSPRIDWGWIRQGLRVSVFFLVGTFALRAVFTLDRYLVEEFVGREMLGVYTLYFGICNSLISFVDAAVFSFRYPRLVSLYKTGERQAFESARRAFRQQTLIAVAALALSAALLVVPVLKWIGKPLYLQHLPVFYLLLATSALFVIGHIPHYALYAMGRDRSIVGTHLGGFVVFVGLGLLLGPGHGLAGVVIAMLAAVVFIGALKQWCFASLYKLGIAAGA